MVRENQVPFLRILQNPITSCGNLGCLLTTKIPGSSETLISWFLFTESLTENFFNKYPLLWKDNMRNCAWAAIRKDSVGCLHGTSVYFKKKTIPFHSANSIRSRLAFYDLRHLLVELDIFRGARKYRKMLVHQGWMDRVEYETWRQTRWLELNIKLADIRTKFIFMRSGC